MDIKAEIAGIEEIKRKLADLRQNQLPYALMTAINKTADEISKAEVEAMKKVFDRPTPYVLNSTKVKYAKKQNPASEIGFREDSGKNTPTSKYLWPQAYGGGRNLKRFEKALQERGVLLPGMYAVPGKGATLDAYGNMSAGLIVKILAYFDAFAEGGYKANMTAQKRAKMAKGTKKTASLVYFVSEGRGSVSWDGKPQHLPPGIYARYGTAFGSSISCIIRFVKKPGYRKRYPFEETAEKVADITFSNNLHFAIDKAIETAK